MACVADVYLFLINKKKAGSAAGVQKVAVMDVFNLNSMKLYYLLKPLSTKNDSDRRYSIEKPGLANVIITLYLTKTIEICERNYNGKR